AHPVRDDAGDHGRGHVARHDRPLQTLALRLGVVREPAATLATAARPVPACEELRDVLGGGLLVFLELVAQFDILEVALAGDRLGGHSSPPPGFTCRCTIERSEMATSSPCWFMSRVRWTTKTMRPLRPVFSYTSFTCANASIVSPGRIGRRNSWRAPAMKVVFPNWIFGSGGPPRRAVCRIPGGAIRLPYAPCSRAKT